MEPYLLIFFVNLLCSYIAEKCYVINKRISALLLIMLVIINTMFSGFRDFGVGIDTTIYINSFFQSAQMLNSIQELLTYEGDKGFLILAFIATIFSDDSQALLVVTALFIQGFYFGALWLYKKNNNVSLFLATFFFCIFFYCHTLNLMRQFCAMSLLAYGFAWFVRGNWKIYICCQLLAYFFHSTSILFVIVPLVWHISCMKDTTKRNLYSVISIIGIAIAVSSFFLLISILGDYGLLSDVYSERYSQTGSYANRMNVGGTGLGAIVVFIYPIAFIYYAKKRKAIADNVLHFLLVLTFFTSFLQLLVYKVSFLERIAYYITYILVIFQVKLFSSSKINVLIKLLMISIYIFNWYNLYIIYKGGDVVPYKSHILNII